MGLVKSLANAEELPNPPKGPSPVYFDYLGLFFVTYRKSVAVYVNVVISALAIIVPLALNYFDKSKLKLKVILYKTVISVLTAAAGLIISLASCVLLAFVFGAADKTMSW